MNAPTRAGQAVRNIRTGDIGVTTNDPYKTTPQIPVQWIGKPYPVKMQLQECERIDVEAAS